VLVDGLILHLQRFSTEDGPGIRTTVFFKGCPLRCAWCHNPESISPHKQIQWIAARCIGCHSCLEVCPNAALSQEGEEIRIEWAKCQGCGECVIACPGGALEILGTRMSAEALAGELKKDRAFFNQSAGGVTLSGGEPLLQPEFTIALLAELRKRAIPAALDTCGVCAPETFKAALDLAEILLFDIKLLDAGLHRQYTGGDNLIVLKNLAAAADHFRAHPEKRFWIRTPLIPGATANRENLTTIGSFIKESAADALERWELCAFNNLGRDKYRRLGLEWKFNGEKLMTADDLENCRCWACASGIDPQLVQTSGATRLEEDPTH